MTEREPGEDLGIGWGVAEDSQTDAMGVNDARDWNDPEASVDKPTGPNEAQVDRDKEDDNPVGAGGDDR